MKRKLSDGKYEFAIHEIFYDEDGSIKAYTEEPVCEPFESQKE